MGVGCGWTGSEGSLAFLTPALTSAASPLTSAKHAFAWSSNNKPFVRVYIHKFIAWFKL